MNTIAERVAAGTAFLDQHDPDWWKAGVERAIDLATLDLDEPALCILGQRCPVGVLAEYCNLDPADEDELSAEWWRAYTAYAIELSHIPDFCALAEWGDRHGFSNSFSWDTYLDLTAEWYRVITERRAATS